MTIPMSNRDEHHRRLEHMYLSAPANEYFKPEIRIDEGRAEVRLTVRPDFFHAASAVHGSVYFKLLDDATFFAASSLVDDVFVLTASFNILLSPSDLVRHDDRPRVDRQPNKPADHRRGRARGRRRPGDRAWHRHVHAESRVAGRAFGVPLNGNRDLHVR